MANVLDKILAQKEKEVAKIKHMENKLRIAALARGDYHSLQQALDSGERELAVIAEIKKSSPSAGVIAKDIDVSELARSYQEAGAAAISVLTDAKFFDGSLAYLKEVRNVVDIPLLRKDFIIDMTQVYEASIAGADAILLIVAALSDDKLHALHEMARSIGLDVLVEIHNITELDRALEIDGIEIIGINNRDLNSFHVDLATCERLSEEVPEDIALVCESGINRNEDALRMLGCGADAVLVGEALMKNEGNPDFLQTLRFPKDNMEKLMTRDNFPKPKDGLDLSF